MGYFRVSFFHLYNNHTLLINIHLLLCFSSPFDVQQSVSERITSALFDWLVSRQGNSVEAIFSVTDFVLARPLYDFPRVENRDIFVDVVILLALSQCLSTL